MDLTCNNTGSHWPRAQHINENVGIHSAKASSSQTSGCMRVIGSACGSKTLSPTSRVSGSGGLKWGQGTSISNIPQVTWMLLVWQVHSEDQWIPNALKLHSVYSVITSLQKGVKGKLTESSLLGMIGWLHCLAPKSQCLRQRGDMVWLVC